MYFETQCLIIGFVTKKNEFDPQFQPKIPIHTGDTPEACKISRVCVVLWAIEVIYTLTTPDACKNTSEIQSLLEYLEHQTH